MHPISSIVLHPHSDMSLHKGGLHIMLVDTDKVETKGKVVPVTLVFEDGSEIRLHVKVK
jgi:copper(I)-binding protein